MAAGDDAAGPAALEAGGPGSSARNRTETATRKRTETVGDTAPGPPPTPSDPAAGVIVRPEEAAGWVDLVAGALAVRMDEPSKHAAGGEAGDSGAVGAVLLQAACMHACIHMYMYMYMYR